VLIHKDWIYVANPRTASRSTESMLEDVLRGKCTIPPMHHPKTDHPALKSGLPIFGVVRHPLDQLVSWFNHMHLTDFDEFIRTPKHKTWLLNDRLTIYASYMTHALPYEWGVRRIVSTILGYDDVLGYEEPHIGGSGTQRPHWTQDLISSKQVLQRL